MEPRLYSCLLPSHNVPVAHLGFKTGVILDIRARRPCSRAPVPTTRVYGPSTRPVNTGNAYRASAVQPTAL